MANEFVPEVGDWYKDDSGASFEVVAIDEAEGLVEVQFFDGNIASFDMETWFELELARRAPPEDWSGALDVDAADLDGGDLAGGSRDWDYPLDAVENDD